jgi:phosphoenolpyruvate carboxylase
MGDDITCLPPQIGGAWLSDEIRRKRPTPDEEAMGGLAVIEQSLCTHLRHQLPPLSAFCVA